jgi:hypothetical protein
MTDSPTGGRFDPRFNPAFQPGYDPSVREPSVRDSNVQDSNAQPQPPSVANRTSAPELIEHPLSQDPAGSVTVDEWPLAVGGIPGQQPRIARRFDPYLSSLLALSVAFVSAGVLAIFLIADRMDRLSGSGTAFDYNLVLVYTIAAPLLVVLGLATATATLFLLASRRR